MDFCDRAAVGKTTSHLNGSRRLKMTYEKRLNAIPACMDGFADTRSDLQKTETMRGERRLSGSSEL